MTGKGIAIMLLTFTQTLFCHAELKYTLPFPINCIANWGDLVVAASDAGVWNCNSERAICSYPVNAVEIQSNTNIKIVTLNGWLREITWAGEVTSEQKIEGLPPDNHREVLYPGLCWPFLLCNFGPHPLSGIHRIDSGELEDRFTIEGISGARLRGLIFNNDGKFWIAQERALKLRSFEIPEEGDIAEIDSTIQFSPLLGDRILGISGTIENLWIAVWKNDRTEIHHFKKAIKPSRRIKE